MLKNKSGDLLGVFHRDDVGDIDLVWGDRKKNSGLDHIIEKHIERLKDFSSAEEAIQVIEDVINNGQIDEKKSKWDKITIKYGDFTVVLRKNVRDENGNIIDSNKNWVVTAFDATISPKRKEVNSSDVTRVTLNTNKGGRAVTADERTSDSKDSELSQKSKEDAEENKKPRLEKADSKATEVSSTDALLRDALVDVMRKIGIEVITDNKKAQRVLEEENESVCMQAKLDSLVKSVRTIHGWLSNNKRDKVFTIELPKATQEMIHKVMGRDFNSHNITANGIAHGLKNHGVNGLKLNKQSIPIRKEDAELIPYIMTAPDYVKKGSTDISGRESIRFYKELSNGYVVVVEKEYKNSLNDMETINIWAEMSSEATNALHKAVPDIHVQNAILSTDIAKIRKDAEDAIRRDNKLREQRVWHGTGRNYVIFNESDAKIVDKVRFFRTANGEAYGFTVDGKIYLDPTIAGAETAIHEYTHLWATALKNANPKEWSNIVSLLKGTPLWDKVASEYPELTTDDELADEVLAHYSGKRGAERLRKEAESIANGKGSLLDKAGAISALERVKEALTRFWKATADLLHIHFTTAEEVADKVLADLLNSVNPNEVAKEYRRKQKQLERINETNPMLDDYHVGIRGLSDILTMREAIEEARQEAEEGDYETLSAYPDITNEMLEDALQSGKITVYSSKPIKDGNFVTPSRMQAEDYAGDGRVYSKTVSIDDVAWINTDEGQFVKNRKDKAEKAPLRFQFIGEQGAEESTSGEDLEEVNARFNEELQQQIDGTLPQGHIYNMGRPGKILLSTGIPNLPIQMNATKLKDKSTKFGHDYELSEVKDLVRALQHPLAVFAYGNKTKAQNIIIPLKRGDKNFIVGLSLNPIIDGHKLEINSIRNVFPKNNAEWLNWITQGKTLYLDKEKIQTLINQQRTILADVEYLDLDSITKITQTSDNPSIDEENLFRKPVGGNSGYVGYSMSKRAEQAREDGRFPKTDFKREYKVSESSLQALSRIGIISDNEWHHTSSYGNKTTFYGWADEAFAEYYLEHKKEIDKATDDLLRLKEEDIDKYFSALDDFRKEMRKSFDVGTSGLSKSKYDFEQELRSRTSDEVVAEYQRQKSEYTSTESNPKPFPSILKWQSQNKDLVKEIENKVRQEMDQSSAIADSVMSLAERLHLDNVEIVTDASALSGKEAKAKGFYTKSTGKITIVVPNNISAEDAVQTLLHEAMAHYGLRQLFGSEFDNFLDAVLENADKEVLERIYDLAQANGWDYRKATEEYLATLAETTEFENTDKGWWNKVKKLFVDMLRKLGIKALDGTTLTDNELRYILWASYQNLKGTNDSLIGLANDIVKREDLGIEKTEDDKLFRTEAEQPISYEQTIVRDLYDQRMASGVYQSIEALQDSMRSVKEFMGMVDKAENGKARYIEDIDDFENAYLGENRLSSQNKAETDLSANLLLKPLLRAMTIWIFQHINCHKIHSEYIKGQ